MSNPTATRCALPIQDNSVARQSSMRLSMAFILSVPISFGVLWGTRLIALIRFFGQGKWNLGNYDTIFMVMVYGVVLLAFAAIRRNEWHPFIQSVVVAFLGVVASMISAQIAFGTVTGRWPLLSTQAVDGNWLGYVGLCLMIASGPFLAWLFGLIVFWTAVIVEYALRRFA